MEFWQEASPYFENLKNNQNQAKECIEKARNFYKNAKTIPGGDFTPDGNFATPVQLSYLTDGEKLLGRLPKFVIKSSVYDIFGKDFIGMSKDKLYLRGNHNIFVTRMDIKSL